MLENLFDLVKQHAGDAVTNNPAIPNEQNDAVVSEASNSILGGLQGALAGGNIKDVLSMFSGNQPVENNNVAQNIQGGFIDNLVNKFGIDKSQAGGIASSLIPIVLQKLVHKTNDPNDSSFDLQGMLNNFSGGKTSGFDVNGLLNKFKGGAFDKDGDGDTDLQDVVAMFKGGGQGGGILDTVKGLFQ